VKEGTVQTAGTQACRIGIEWLVDRWTEDACSDATLNPGSACPEQKSMQSVKTVHGISGASPGANKDAVEDSVLAVDRGEKFLARARQPPCDILTGYHGGEAAEADGMTRGRGPM